MSVEDDRQIARDELQKYTKELDELRHSSNVYADIDAYRLEHGEIVELPFFLVDIEEYDLLQQRVQLWSWIHETLEKNQKETIKSLMLESRQSAESIYTLEKQYFYRYEMLSGYGSKKGYLRALNNLNKSRNMLNILTVQYNDDIPFNEENYTDPYHDGRDDEDYGNAKHRKKPFEERPRGKIFTPLGPDEKAKETLLSKYKIHDKKSYHKFMLDNHPDKNPKIQQQKTELTQKVNQLMEKAAFPWW